MSLPESLPTVLFVVLFELAVGGAFLMWLIDRGGDAPAGFLRLTAVVGVAAAALGALIGPSLPASAAFVRNLGYVVAAFVVGYFVATFLPSRQPRLVVGAATIVAGLLLLVAASTLRAGNPFDALALVALPLGAGALGGSNAAMLLGHWYLVTPKLPPGPLQKASFAFFAAVALQAMAAGIAVARGDLPLAWETSAVAVVIRLALGIAAPVVIALGAWWTARMNTQSSTGLLYIALGMVLAGELSARVLFYVTGVAL